MSMLYAGRPVCPPLILFSLVVLFPYGQRPHVAAQAAQAQAAQAKRAHEWARAAAGP